jgi:hypothetical protein
MTRAFILTLALIIWASCASGSASRVNKIANENQSALKVSVGATPTPTKKVSEASEKPNKSKDVPPEFSGIDFKNFTYPTSFGRDWKKERTTLKDGTYEYADRKESSFGTLDLMDVDYADINGDGKKEAIVQLNQVHCGGSCDGGAILFYFYAIRQGKLTLLQRINTESLGYGCGLKSFTSSRETLTIEVFRKCSYSGGTFTTQQQLGKFEAHEFTRFEFKFIRGRFVVTKREVLPHPSGDVLQ